jgi:hypothetical protein
LNGVGCYGRCVELDGADERAVQPEVFFFSSSVRVLVNPVVEPFRCSSAWSLMKAELKSQYGDALVRKYDPMLFGPFPDRFAELLSQLDRKTAHSQVVEEPTRKTLLKKGDD